VTLQLDRVRLERHGQTILHPVNLTLPATGAVAIIGPNGAGKSSLLALMAGLQEPTQGQVRLAGKALSHLGMAQRAALIGYMPQKFAPYWDITVEELFAIRHSNLRAPGTQPDPASSLARHGILSLAQRRWGCLSGGEQGRLLLATVLATEPAILLADEPGAALDVRHRLDLVHRLAERGRKHLVVVVMHDIDLAFQHFERIIVVNQGRIVLDGGHDLLESTLLDQHFNVRFERICATPRKLLRAHLPDDHTLQRVA